MTQEEMKPLLCVLFGLLLLALATGLFADLLWRHGVR
jgi:hypothetical protein